MVEHKLTVSKQFVRNALRIMDPEGVGRRSRHRLQTRQYHEKGPNFIWHLDEYDKLKPYKLWVLRTLTDIRGKSCGMRLGVQIIILVS